MQNGLRILSFATIAAALLVFAALGSRAKVPRSGAEFPRPAVDQPTAAQKGKETAVLSGGCFWGVQAVYQHTRGVISATSGYAGGDADTASYNVRRQRQNRARQSVKIVYDPSQITYG